MTARRPAARRESRRLALQVLYAADLVHGEAPEAVFERVAENFDLHPGALAFAKELVCGTMAVREEIDAQIAAHARNWRLDRMAAVDRNLLRLAVYELLRTDTPARSSACSTSSVVRTPNATGMPVSRITSRTPSVTPRHT